MVDWSFSSTADLVVGLGILLVVAIAAVAAVV